MYYTDDDLIGLESPPLVNGEFSVCLWARWRSVNKLRPTDMTYDKWKEYNNSRYNNWSPEIKLSQLAHWFDAVKSALQSGESLGQNVVEDYNKRAKQ